MDHYINNPIENRAKLEIKVGEVAESLKGLKNPPNLDQINYMGEKIPIYIDKYLTLNLEDLLILRRIAKDLSLDLDLKSSIPLYIIYKEIILHSSSAKEIKKSFDEYVESLLIKSSNLSIKELKKTYLVSRELLNILAIEGWFNNNINIIESLNIDPIFPYSSPSLDRVNIYLEYSIVEDGKEEIRYSTEEEFNKFAREYLKLSLEDISIGTVVNLSDNKYIKIKNICPVLIRDYAYYLFKIKIKKAKAKEIAPYISPFMSYEEVISLLKNNLKKEISVEHTKFEGGEFAHPYIKSVIRNIEKKNWAIVYSSEEDCTLFLLKFKYPIDDNQILKDKQKGKLKRSKIICKYLSEALGIEKNIKEISPILDKISKVNDEKI